MSRLANYNRKDPNEEFFKMTLLSFKINSKISSKVFEIDSTELYKDCQKSKLPFYKWPRWIENTLMRRILSQKYNNYETRLKLKLMEAK